MVLNACDSKDAFQEHASGLKYRISYKSNTGIKPEMEDILKLNMKYYTAKDSLLFDTREFTHEYKMQMRNPSHKGGCIEDAFSLMEVGDSITALVDAVSFFTETKQMKIPSYVKQGDVLRFEIKLLDKISIKKHYEEVVGASVGTEKEENELLSNYLKVTNVQVEPTNSGLYYIETQAGSGISPKLGDRVVVDYFGTFISGKPFSTTYGSGAPFEFTFGVGEVIDGWEEGISYMKEGGKARLVIPSHLAYGSEGKGDAIPPYSTLIFELELHKVIPKK